MNSVTTTSATTTSSTKNSTTDQIVQYQKSAQSHCAKVNNAALNSVT